MERFSTLVIINKKIDEARHPIDVEILQAMHDRVQIILRELEEEMAGRKYDPSRENNFLSDDLFEEDSNGSFW